MLSCSISFWISLADMSGGRTQLGDYPVYAKEAVTLINHSVQFFSILASTGMTCLRLQAHRHRRCFMYQGNGYAAIRRHEPVLRKKWIGIGLAGHLVNVGGRIAFLLQDLAHGIGPVDRKVPQPVVRSWWRRRGGGVAGDGNPVRRRLERSGD